MSRVSNLAGLEPNSIDDNDEVFVDQSLTSISRCNPMASWFSFEISDGCSYEA